MMDKPSGETQVCLICSDAAPLDGPVCPKCATLAKKADEHDYAPTLRSEIDNLAAKMEFPTHAQQHIR